MMSDDDIVRAANALRKILDTAYPNAEPIEMDSFYQGVKHVPIRVQAEHLKRELATIPQFLAEGTERQREKAFRWLSDVGGVMRSEMHLLSLDDVRALFRPEADTADLENQLELPVA